MNCVGCLWRKWKTIAKTENCPAIAAVVLCGYMSGMGWMEEYENGRTALGLSWALAELRGWMRWMNGVEWKPGRNMSTVEEGGCGLSAIVGRMLLLRHLRTIAREAPSHSLLAAITENVTEFHVFSWMWALFCVGFAAGTFQVAHSQASKLDRCSGNRRPFWWTINWAVMKKNCQK